MFKCFNSFSQWSCENNMLILVVGLFDHRGAKEKGTKLMDYNKIKITVDQAIKIALENYNIEGTAKPLPGEGGSRIHRHWPWPLERASRYPRSQ